MIRQHDHQDQLFYTATELPPPSPNSVYARLSAVVGDWRALAQPLEAVFSAHTGRPTDPVVYLKIFLIGYLENLVYDTELAERIDDSRALRHFLGYTLAERTPDHCSISRVRQRLAAHDMTAVLDTVVAMCVAAGLVTGEVVATDASLLRAHASRASFRPKPPVQPVADHVAAASAANPLPVEALNRRVASTTDPDARLRSKGRDRAIPSYLLTHVTDGQGQIILAASVATAECGEVAAALPPLRQAQATLAAHGHTLGTVLADTGYDALTFHVAVEALGATPLTSQKPDSSGKPVGFRKADFTYDPYNDQYLCPRGERLHYKCTDPKRARRRYVSNAAVCADCPCRAACLSSTGNQRWVCRPRHEPSRQAVVARAQTPAGHALLTRRKAIVEAPFGHHKTYGGLARLNCRGLGAVQVKCLFAAIAWNLIRLTRHLRADLLSDVRFVQRTVRRSRVACIGKQYPFSSPAKKAILLR